MQRFQSHAQLEWLEFDLLSDLPRVKHAVYLRQGGSSLGLYAGLNTSFTVGDNDLHVQTNIQKIQDHNKEDLSYWKGLTWGRANHGKNIAFIHRYASQEVIDFDGLITSTPGLTLMMKHADCQVALIYDPIHHAAANVHAGWRGSVVNIFAEAIERMHFHFGSKPADLLVCISPSLGPDEAEFVNYQSELPEDFWRFQVRPTFFDFWSISEYQLQTAGILPHHIEIAKLSTYANPQDYYSYRRDKTTGRHGTCITLL